MDGVDQLGWLLGMAAGALLGTLGLLALEVLLRMVGDLQARRRSRRGNRFDRRGRKR
jgi:hypothetical protein